MQNLRCRKCSPCIIITYLRWAITCSGLLVLGESVSILWTAFSNANVIKVGGSTIVEVSVIALCLFLLLIWICIRIAGADKKQRRVLCMHRLLVLTWCQRSYPHFADIMKQTLKSKGSRRYNFGGLGNSAENSANNAEFQTPVSPLIRSIHEYPEYDQQ
jgi:hypothetical protein